MTAPAPYNQDRPRQGNPPQPINTSAFAQAVRNGIDNEFIKWAETFGNWIANPKDFGRDKNDCVSTSQIRNVYGTVKKIEMRVGLDLPSILLLKPRIYYAAEKGASKKSHKAYKDFRDAVVGAIDAVQQDADNDQKQIRFERFCKGFEAILAYHRAAGGK